MVEHIALCGGALVLFVVERLLLVVEPGLTYMKYIGSSTTTAKHKWWSNTATCLRTPCSKII